MSWRPGVSLRVNALTGALYLAAGAAAWVTLTRPAPNGAIPLGGALLLIIVVADRLRAQLEFRGEAFFFDLSAVGVLLALASSSRVMGLAGIVLSGVLQWATTRSEPVKALFNIANPLLGLSAAMIVLDLVAGDADIAGPAGWVVLPLATLTSSTVTCLGVWCVISLVNGRLEPFGTMFRWSSLVSIGNSSLGLLTVQLLVSDARAAWMIVAPAIGLWLGYRSFLKLRQRYGSLNLLHAFSHSLSGATESDDVAATALTMGTELLRAEHAQLVFRLRDGALVKELDEHGTLTTAAFRTGGLPAVAELLELKEPLLIPAGEQHPELAALAQRLAVADLVAAPFTADGFEGVFVVSDRLSDVSTFDGEDAKVLQTFAQNTGVALKVGELVDKLRREVADREFQALHDSLTGLANRTRLNEVVEELVDAAPLGTIVGVVLMDLDDFKDVNDALGHSTGDALLAEIGRRLTAAVSARGTVARLGGDEFAIAVCCRRDTAELLAFVEQIRSLVEEPYVVDRLTLAVRFSIGVAVSPDHGTDPKILLQRADIAMYAAKAAHIGVKLYADELDTSSRRRLSLAGELGQALERREFQLFYQPQLDLRTGRVMAIEALARWPHPEHKSVQPDEFIPLVEQSGLIGAFTDWALQSALRDVALWREEWPDLRVSVNMSARNLMDPDFPDAVARHLAEAGLHGDALTLELTESTVMSEPELALGVLARLHDLGIRIAIDDFGTGYSSLSYLRRLPVDEVKIDKSFVMNMVGNAEDTAIVRSTIDLARSLGMDTVAEGVENVEAMESLAKLGCWAAQGYHLSRPVPSADIADKLRLLNRTYGGSLTITLSSDPTEDRLIHFGSYRR